MYSGALRTFHRWYECRDGWQRSSTDAAMPSEIGFPATMAELDFSSL